MHPSDLKDLKVAVVGGGYGGAAAAAALRNIGVGDVHVYERAAAVREVGAGIGLRPATVELFRKWGIYEAIAAVTSPSDSFEILTATGHVLHREEWPASEHETKTRFVHRDDFINAFLDVLPAGMLHIGRRVTGIEDGTERATVVFADGASVTADLVIGADGIRSLVRQQLFSDVPPVFSESHAYRAVISADDTYGMTIDDNLRLYIGDNGTTIYFLPLRHRNQVSFDITAPSADASWSPEITKADLMRLVEGFDERLQSITRDLDMDLVTSRAVYDIDPIDTWHTDCVALLGDAAHAMLHHQGQGANSAITDAGALADALVKADSVKAALVEYQAVRKPVTDELQRISRLGWDAGAVETAFPGQKGAE
ncbi:FAD-dependent oxidoreductase [Capillimicrobium parvum]|uniref:6-hydroxynicotinate 3-monooxygenase n=1 Tax=Capillimicrobium parvum TaxID=2884022 RepID=A0A9E7C0S2_9ACTN|nr:NAD(P)/FAD-dependent oxidoreductase [Capillimicrobium parvum]UGS36676.1 6-hydroxynicotinate 3-monooxygenase [Capillimicrobium parvum]